jgi:hypothetical protein
MDNYLYGLHSWYENNRNKRGVKLSDNIYIGTTEINYIHEVPILGDIIINFLKSKCTIVDGNITEYYTGIKSFEFQPVNTTDPNNPSIKDCLDEDIINIQKMINISYDINLKEGEQYPYKIDWMKLNTLRKLFRVGYGNELSKFMTDYPAIIAKDIFEKHKELPPHKLQRLELTSRRTCDNYHNVKNISKPNTEINKLLLEDELIKPGEHQLIISNMATTDLYKSNVKTLINPWLYEAFNLGGIVWNLGINKSSINCIMRHSPSLFPARIILNTHPNELYYKNYMTNFDTYKFLGFFIIRYDKTNTDIPENINEACKKLYDFTNSNPHTSKEQYYVQFVFKKKKEEPVITSKYIIINYRNNRVKWGDVSDLYRYLYSEIKQFMCMYVNNDVYFYLLSKVNKKKYEQDKNIYKECNTQLKNNILELSINNLNKIKKQHFDLLRPYITDIDEYNKIQSKIDKKNEKIIILTGKKSIQYKDDIETVSLINNDISQLNCEINKLQNKKNKLITEPKLYNIIREKIDNINKLIIQKSYGKKSFKKCTQAWYDLNTYDYLVQNNFSLLLNENDIQIFVSKFDINEVFNKLKTNGLITPSLISINDEKTIITININGEEYKLLYCHFLFSEDAKLASTYKSFEEYIIGKNIPQHEQRREYNKYIKEWNIYIKNMYKLPEDRFVLKHGTINDINKKLYQENFCINDKCILDIDYHRNMKLNSLMQIDSESEIKIFDMSEQYKQEVTQLSGGGNNNKYLSKINKYLLKINKIIENNNYTHHYNKNHLLYKLTHYDNKDKDKKYSNQIYYNTKNNTYNLHGTENPKMTNLLSIQSTQLAFVLSYIINTILIISENINFADIILNIFTNIKIILIAINIKNIKLFIILKQKYKKLIDIYFLGNVISYDTYKQIAIICNNLKFNTIIIDCGINHEFIYNKLNALSILVINSFLENDGYVIKYMYIPLEISTNFYLFNIEFDLFRNQIYKNAFTIMSNNIIKILEYTNFNKRLNNIIKNNIINYLKLNNFDQIFDHNNYYSILFLKFYYLLCQNIYFYFNKNKKSINNNEDKQYNQDGGGIHTITNKYINYNKIPIYIDDIVFKLGYNIDNKDYPPLCHWGQLKLLLSEIQFFTDINIKNFKDYVVVYIGSADGAHLPILFNMFPDLLWLLYDPNPFNKNVKRFGKNKIKIFNQYFLDETIEHVKRNTDGRKILFISDIRVKPTEEQVMADMAKQAKWGMELNSDYMFLKFRLPYNDEENFSFIPTTISDLNIDAKYFDNPDFIAKNTIYLKGQIYLQIFPPPYSTELRILVTKNKNGKYDLDNYNYIDMENKLFSYNNSRRIYSCLYEYRFLNVIVGFDDGIECVMAYNIIKKYYEIFHNIKDNNILLQKTYDLIKLLEKLTNIQFSLCNYNSSIKKLKKNNDKESIIKINLWSKIIDLNIYLNLQYQLEYIKNYGEKILGKNRYNESIAKLNKLIKSHKFEKSDKFIELIIDD